MTENVFENAPLSLQKAKDETLAILRAEEARHETALEIETTYHAKRKEELNQIIIALDTRMPEMPTPVLGTTPLPQTYTNGPHSRACGWAPHEHGFKCHDTCPTCHNTEGRVV